MNSRFSYKLITSKHEASTYHREWTSISSIYRITDSFRRYNKLEGLIRNWLSKKFIYFRQKCRKLEGFFFSSLKIWLPWFIPKSPKLEEIGVLSFFWSQVFHLLTWSFAHVQRIPTFFSELRFILVLVSSAIPFPYRHWFRFVVEWWIKS